MEHRVFIAINLPSDIKKLLFNYQNNHQDVPAKWIAEKNLHITAVFIGDVDDKNLPQLHKSIEEVIKKQKSFVISLKNIGYSLPQVIPPRMIWAIGEKSAEFILLCDNLGKILLREPNFSLKSENREIITHITVARIKEWEWRRIEPDERPEIGEIVDFSFEVNSIELMESVLKITGPEYKILESYKLK